VRYVPFFANVGDGVSLFPASRPEPVVDRRDGNLSRARGDSEQ
jgi:hypothetical protein